MNVNINDKYYYLWEPEHKNKKFDCYLEIRTNENFKEGEVLLAVERSEKKPTNKKYELTVIGTGKEFQREGKGDFFHRIYLKGADSFVRNF